MNRNFTQEILDLYYQYENTPAFDLDESEVKATAGEGNHIYVKHLSLDELLENVKKSYLY